MVGNNTMGIGIQECNTDRDCRDELKCCSNGFGNQCMQPERNISREDCMSITAECLNGGTCVSTIGGGYFCMCTVHYTGPNCRTRIPTACDSSPCKNGATCQPYRNGDYSCSCPSSWGKNCENPNYDTCRCEFNQRCILKEECYMFNCTVRRKCQDQSVYDPCGRRPCSQNSVCVVTRDNVSFRCQCKPGFSGPDCNTNNNLCDKYNITTFCRRYDYNSYCLGDLKNGRLCNCSQGRSGIFCEVVNNSSEPSPCQQKKYFYGRFDNYMMTARYDEAYVLQRLAAESDFSRGLEVNCTSEGHFHPVQCRNESDIYNNWMRKCYCVDQRGNIRSNLTKHAGYAPCTAPNMTEDLSRVICTYPQAMNLCWNGGRCRGDLFKGKICDCAPGFGGIFCQRRDNDTSDEPTSLCTLSKAAFNLMKRIKNGNFSWTYNDMTIDPTTIATGNGSFSDVMDRFSQLLLSGFESMTPPLKDMIDSSYIPQPNCSWDGEFLPTQCDVSLSNGTTSACYCVYRNGTEIPGSRTTYPMMPYCSHMSNSTGSECIINCSLDCPNGRRRGMDGCDICECKASCDGVFCGRGAKCIEGVCRPTKKMGQCPVQVHDNYYQMLNSTYQESCSTDCQDDSDCSGDKKCCPGCGTTCLDPIEQKSCQAHWWDVNRRLSAIKNFTSFMGNIGQLMEPSSTIVGLTWKPVCDRYGNYIKEQCSYEIVADGNIRPVHCFCVNKNGVVVRGTKKNVTMETVDVFSCEDNKPGVCPLAVNSSVSSNMSAGSCQNDYNCTGDDKCCSGTCKPVYSAKIGNFSQLCEDNSNLCNSTDRAASCVGDWHAAKICQCSQGYTGLLCTQPSTGAVTKLTTCQRKRQLFQLIHNGFSSTNVSKQPDYVKLVEALQRSLGNKFYNLSMTATRCKENGAFHEKQCAVNLMTNETDRCYCVNHVGRELLGTETKPPHNINCLPKPMQVCKEGKPLGNGKTYIRCQWNNNVCGHGYKCEQQKVTSGNGDYYEEGYCCLDRRVSDPCNMTVDFGVNETCGGSAEPVKQVRYYYDPMVERCMSYSVTNCTSLPVNTNSFSSLNECLQRCEKKVKKGTCPIKPPSYGPGQQCSDQCKNDDVCSGDRKCCQTSCGKRCILANDGLSNISQREPCRPGLTPTLVNKQPVNCGRGTNGQCPAGSYCDIAADDTWAVCCPDSAIDVCALKVDTGPCKAAIPRWAFNKNTGRCEKFNYGGCAGNDNNFNSKEECCNACGSNQCKDDECPAIKPGVLATCADTCTHDSDCEGRQLCCSNGCGRTCMIPTKNSSSTCFKELEKSRLQMMMMKPNQCSTVFLPRCNADGTWKKEQCLDSYGLCWCSSSDGIKFSSPQRGRLSCDDNFSVNDSTTVQVCDGESIRCCSPHLCKMAACPADPHAVCRVNPCGGNCSVDFYNKDNQKVNCTAGLSKCELHQYKALISRYQHKLNNITTHPPSTDNNNNLTQSTRASVDVCKQPKIVGMCRAYFPRWYYNATTSNCEKFVYGGCQGNENNFPRAEECYARCNPQQHPCKTHSCPNADELCVIQSDPNCNNGACRHGPSCTKATPSTQLSGVYMPTCSDDKSYRLKQCHEGYCWCVNENGDVFPNSVTSGPLDCSSDGPLTETFTRQVCPDQSSPNKECLDACRSKVCPDHPDAVCRVDLCSPDCSVKFVNATGNEVSCGSDSCKVIQALPNKDCIAPVMCPNGGNQRVCDPSICREARCPGNPCAVCSVDPCTCNAIFTDMLTNETVTDCLLARTPTCRMKKCSIRNEENRAMLMGVAVDLWEPECETDGRYKSRQCDDKQCWCVDGRGEMVASINSNNCVRNETASVVVQVKFEKDFEQVKNKMPEFEAAVLNMMKEWGISEFVNSIKISAGSVIVETTFKDKNADSSNLPDPILAVVPDLIQNKVRNGEAKLMFENEAWVAKPTYFESKSESQVYRPEVATGAPPPGEEGLGEKMIIVISVVCTVVGCVIIGIIVWACCCRQRKQDRYIEDTIYQSGKSSPELPFGVSNNLYMTSGASPHKPHLSAERDEDIVNYKL